MSYQTLEKFNFNNKDYEVRLSSVGKDIIIKVYTDNQPANGYSYHVTLEVQSDMKVLTGLNAVKELSNIAKDDVIKQRWEGLIEAIRSSEA